MGTAFSNAGYGGYLWNCGFDRRARGIRMAQSRAEGKEHDLMRVFSGDLRIAIMHYDDRKSQFLQMTLNASHSRAHESPGVRADTLRPHNDHKWRKLPVQTKHGAKRQIVIRSTRWAPFSWPGCMRGESMPACKSPSWQLSSRTVGKEQ